MSPDGEENGGGVFVILRDKRDAARCSVWADSLAGKVTAG